MTFLKGSSRYFLILSISLIVCLVLLINVSYKIVETQGELFSVNALLCPVIAALYLLVLKTCSISEQRQVLNLCLMALYGFPIGVFFLINLPIATEYMHNSPAYHIVFEAIPKKFFATTLSFFLSLYFPHWCYRVRESVAPLTTLQAQWLAIGGGLGFFVIDFWLLFKDLSIPHVQPTFLFSLAIITGFLTVIGVFDSAYNWCFGISSNQAKEKGQKNGPILYYQCMVCIAVVVMLICLVCEYRLVAFSNGWTLVASGMFFPIVLMISTLIGELYGYQANMRFTMALICTQLLFDGLLMGLVALPSPAYFNINPFYNYIMPRRLPAASLALLVTFVTNSFLLEYLKRIGLAEQRITRIVIANVCATSILCLVNYSLLFGGIYAYEEVIHLSLNAWVAKTALMLVGLPLTLLFFNAFEKKNGATDITFMN